MFLKKFAQIYNGKCKPLRVAHRWSSSEVENRIVLGEMNEIHLPKTYKCDSSNPGDHGLKDEGLFYTVPDDIHKLICPENGSRKALRKTFQRECNAFKETNIMIRRPALEIINCMKNADYDNPVIRYLIYGNLGTGKSMSLQHVTHYALHEGWIIVPTLYAWDWMGYHRRFKPMMREELKESSWNTDRLDQPVWAMSWLETFKTINGKKLQEIKTTREYVWTKREKTEVGQTLTSLVDQGIARARISTDVIGCIMRELRTQPSENLPRVLVTVDAFNAIFHRTSVKSKLGNLVEPDNLSFIYNLKKMIRNDWTNGAVVLAMNMSGERPELFTRDVVDPYELIGAHGFDLIDPHLPIEVKNYSEKEVLQLLSLYRDKKWLTGRSLTQEGMAEILQVCCGNPEALCNLCSSLY